MPKQTSKSGGGSFKLTYATMYSPPEELHIEYERALARVKQQMGAEQAMIIDGADILAKNTFKDLSPINQDWLLGKFPKGTTDDARKAIDAALLAFPGWAGLAWQERLKIMRRAADLIDERIFEFAAVLSLEVGKNRMEALGDIAEAAELIRYACNQCEANQGFVIRMGKDPLPAHEAQNISKLVPYGVWVVISPFNFPAALTAGPSGAALIAGNTVVMKPATATPWTVRLLAECYRDAGVPNGAINFITGPGSTVGEELINNPNVAGLTFTGSYDVGMHIYRIFAEGPYPRPIILEMGGKNASIVSRKADLSEAALGIVRSAFGLQGQKCSANSRVFVERPVAKDLLDLLQESTNKLTVGDPTERDIFLGPVISRSSYKDFQDFCRELSNAGRLLTGGEVLTSGDLGKGFFCQPTIATDVPPDHRLWRQEMFLPITMVHAVDSLEEAMALANDSLYGLTSGFYGAEDETEWFFANVQAGVNYANRPQGSTTGAWPGYQPFGGWKGSGSTGKNAGGHYYLQEYMREKILTLIR